MNPRALPYAKLLRTRPCLAAFSAATPGTHLAQHCPEASRLRPKLGPVALETSNTRRKLADEVDRYILSDDGELLLEAEEMNCIAIRLEPARPPMREPTLLASSLVSEADGSGEQIFDRNTYSPSRPQYTEAR